MLYTVEFGKIRIMSCHKLARFHYSYIGQDRVCEWNFCQLQNGDIVAVENNEKFWTLQERI